MTSACAILDDVAAQPYPFNRRHARVSRIGYCARQMVAEAIGRAPRVATAVLDELEEFPQRQFPPFYSIWGHALEGWAYEQIRSVYPMALTQLVVRTPAGAETHVDVYVPEIGLAIEVKTATDSWVLRSTGPKAPTLEQALLQWGAWSQAGECRTASGVLLRVVPSRYEVLYLGRGDTKTLAAPCVARRSYPVQWDSDRARRLMAKHLETQACIDLEVLPPRPYTRPQVECDGCPLWRGCWG